MKEYLQNLIKEQINRGYVLKGLVPHPISYSEFTSLAERCSMLIDQYIGLLRTLQPMLQKTDDDEDIRYIFREYRRCVRDLEEIEHSGISVLYFHKEDMVYLNKLIRQIASEINLPLNAPCVASFSRRYFYYVPFTNVIFIPLSESEFLLHIPDLLHELGHYVLSKRGELRLQKLKEKYQKCISLITSYYYQILTRRLTETEPKDLAAITVNTHTQWKEYWLEEFFCDMFATYVLGPAYAWSHIYLVTKKSGDIYSFSGKSISTHPSDESRLRVMLLCLGKMGFDDDKKLIQEKWNDLILVKNRRPTPEYREAYPTQILDQLTSLVKEALAECDFTITSRDKLEQRPIVGVMKRLDDIWRKFWENPDEFRKEEEKIIAEIRKDLK